MSGRRDHQTPPPMARSANQGSWLAGWSVVVILASTLSSVAAGADQQTTVGQSVGNRTTVALTVTASKDEAEQDLAQTFLALLEFNVSQDTDVSVVERMQIELALQELVINRALAASQQMRLQLGQLTHVDLILNARFLPRDDTDTSHHMMVSIVEATSGSIRGLTVTPIDEFSIDESAAQVESYLSAVINAPKQAAVTVAVGAFESTGRFDRLRPLELGIRDMLTARLVSFGRFQVLRRSNMKELVDELDLIQSGLVDRTRLPETMPTRAAAFLIRGTLSEQNENGRYLVSINGAIVHAKSDKKVHEFQFVAAPDKIPHELSKYARQIAGFLVRATELPPGELRQPSGFSETEFLSDQVLADLRRFRRLSPTDHSYRAFSIPGGQARRGHGPRQLRSPVKPASALGRHLLEKSIDRLESILFVQPENAPAAYALGFCYGYHLEGIWQPERGAALLRTVFERDRASELAAGALTILSELSFHHNSGRVAPAYRQPATEHLLFAFEHMPAAHRTFRWSRMLELLGPLYDQQKDYTGLGRAMRKAATIAVQIDQPMIRRRLAQGTCDMAISLCRNGGELPELQMEAKALLTEWSESDEKTLRHAGSRALAILASADKDFVGAAHWYRQAAASYDASAVAVDKYARQNLLIHAARNLRLAGKPKDALLLLESIDRSWAPTSLNHGYYGVELGACYELLGERDKALQTYLDVAEQVPHLADNSDVVKQIQKLGSVPIGEDRDFDVRYVLGPENHSLPFRVVETDGRQLFCAGVPSGPRAIGMMSYDISSNSWKSLGMQLGRVTSIAYTDGNVWVGTKDSGLWRCDEQGNHWMQWSSDEGLPDQHVQSVVGIGETAYVGVGSSASGGLVRIDATGEVHIFDTRNAPNAAPTHVVVDAKRILARTTKAIHQFTFDDRRWTRLTKVGAPLIYPGESTVWASSYGKELYEFDASGSVNDDYRQAWFPRGQGKAGYLVRFLLQHDGQIWFGGSPWARFKSSGIYRVDEESGEFSMYGPRDGFDLGRYDAFDGVWAAGRLWIATSAGLAEVRLRRN